MASAEISIIIATCGLIASIIFNILNANRASRKEKEDFSAEIEKRTKSNAEQSLLLEMLNKNLEKIIEDNKSLNERIYKLSERIAIIEEKQNTILSLSGQINVMDQKINKAHQRIDLLEHDVRKEHDYAKSSTEEG